MRRAGLLIASATAISPIVWRYPWAPEIAHSLKNDVFQNDVLLLDSSGILSDRMRWIFRMAQGFAALRTAMVLAQDAGASVAARRLRALLVRFNLWFALLEAVRSVADEDAILQAIGNHLETVLRDFTRYGIWPPEMIGRALARRYVIDLGGSLDSLSAADCINAASGLGRRAEPLAARARQATRFDELLTTAQECLPIYSAAVTLYYQAIGLERQGNRPFPKDALRDFRVIEEYRVGVLELFSRLGSHLIWRPPFFLRSVPKTGTPLREAMRAALLAARAEISIYPLRHECHVGTGRGSDWTGPTPSG